MLPGKKETMQTTASYYKGSTFTKTEKTTLLRVLRRLGFELRSPARPSNDQPTAAGGCVSGFILPKLNKMNPNSG